MTTAERTGGAPRHHYAALDGMRALAALGVIATHAGFETGRSLDHGPLAPFLARLDFGVTVFFLLSGFLLYRPFARHALGLASRPHLAEFWWRRALRILPAYWLAVIVTLGLISERRASAGDWTSYLLLIHTYNHHNVDPSLTQMWTLAVEVTFYAALPLLAYLPRLLARASVRPLAGQLWLLGGLAILSLGWQLVARHVSGIGLAGLLWLPAYLDWFAAGMLLAVLSLIPSQGRALRGWASDPLTCWIVAGLLFWIATLPVGGPRGLQPGTVWEWTSKHYLYAASAFFLLLPLTLGVSGRIGRVLAAAPMRRLGELSYGIYLWHLALLIAIAKALNWRVFQGSFVELYVLTAGSAIAVAAVSWFGMERPLLRRFSRPWRGGTRAASTSAIEAMQSN
jgi:peptidoglycan/LPS O-acetylase OafA/YrhL